MNTPERYHMLLKLNEQLAQAKHGSTVQLYEQTAEALGLSVAQVRRLRREMKLTPARKRRSDAGEGVLTREQLHLVSGVLFSSTNKKGQRMPVGTAVEMMHANGLIPRVHESTIARQLFRHGLHPTQLMQPTPSVQLRSLGPGHVAQSDSTTGAYYYMPGGRLRWMPEDEFYKNKVANLVKASTDLLTRYCYVDHASGAFKAKYYLGGETGENLLDFLCWAMWKQDDSPMHGVPLILMMDPGAANKSHLVRNFCDRLGIELLHHKPGAARVTGAVEKTHDLVRMYFETRLRFENPRDATLDWLNAHICTWAAAFQTTSEHGRHGFSRYGAWMQVKPEYLRVAASLEALREAAVKQPETRRVSNTMTIPFGGRTYDLTLVPGACAGLKVTVVQNAFRAPAIDVQFTDAETKQECWQVVEPMQVDEWGFRDGAPIIGQEIRTARFSQVDHARNDRLREAYTKPGQGLPTLEEASAARKRHEQAYAGILDAMADVNAVQVPSYLPRRGTPLETEGRTLVAQVLTVVDACKRLKAALGEAYSPQVYTWVSQRWPDGVPEDQLDAIAAQFQPVDADGLARAIEQAVVKTLRVVGGGQ